MDTTTLLEEVLRLSQEDRRMVLEKVWDSLAQDQVVIPPTKSQKRELDRRLADREINRGDFLPWSDVKARLYSHDQ